MYEKRRYVRLNIPLEVSYIIRGREGKRYKSITKNISPKGAELVLEEELPKGTILDLAIKIPENEETVPIKAKVVWSKKDSEHKQGIYNAGFEFIEVGEKSKKIFFQYLCDLMYDQLKRYE